MTLSKLIRKRDSSPIATAIPATSATQMGKHEGTVATVARTTEREHAPITSQAVTAVRRWLDRIGEDDPVTINEIIGAIRSNPEARSYFLERATND